jgi:hypothetical protein
MDYTISTFLSCTQSNKPFDNGFFDTIDRLRNDPKRQEDLVMLAKLDKPARDKIKTSKMLAISPSARMENGGRTENIVEYVPLLFLDADGYATTAEAVEALHRGNQFFGSHLAYSCLSASGLGIHFVIVVDKLTNEADYLYRWNYSNEQIATIGIKLDVNTRKVAGKMIPACHAEYIYLNRDAEPMKFPEQAISTIQIKKERVLDATPDKHVALIDEILSEVEAKGVSFSSGQRNNFIVKVSTWMNKAGVPMTVALDVLERRIMISNYPDHLATVKDIYERYADQFGKYKKRKTKKNSGDELGVVEGAIQFLDARYKFKYNKVLDRVEIQKIAEEKWLPVTDYMYNSLWKEIQKAGINITKNNLFSLLNSDFAVEYDPFRERIDRLPIWNGIDHIFALADTITAVYPDKATVALYLAKWITAMVACMYDTIPNHQVLTFMGGQGIGKTKWVQRFILSGLTDYFYSGPLNPQDKDSRIRLAETNIVSLDELEVLGRYNLGVLKELITIDYINERRPYAARTERLRRRASFAATVNLPEFLKDQSGSRRFLVIEAESLDYTHNIDMEMVFAQAFHMYKNGFVFWFDKTEGENLSEANNRFQVGELTEEVIPMCFRLPETDEKCEKYTVTQIAEILRKRGHYANTDKVLIQTVGSTLRKLGFKKMLSKGKIYYRLIEIKPDLQLSESTDKKSNSAIEDVDDSLDNIFR